MSLKSLDNLSVESSKVVELNVPFYLLSQNFIRVLVPDEGGSYWKPSIHDASRSSLNAPQPGS